MVHILDQKAISLSSPDLTIIIVIKRWNNEMSNTCIFFQLKYKCSYILSFMSSIEPAYGFLPLAMANGAFVAT